MSINTLKIYDKEVGIGQPVFIIAEAGVNHNGDIQQAKRLVCEAKACGADCVKFQFWKTERHLVKNAPKAAYQLKTTSAQESQFEMLQKLELSDAEHRELYAFCRKEGIIYLSSTCDTLGIDFLESLPVSAHKVASPNIIENYFLEYIAQKGKPILLSTGMCNMAEVEEAVNTVRQAGNDRIVVLQCTTNYPSALEDTNLRAMQAMGKAFNVLVGYSDHSPSLIAAPAAVALGACIIEKHFTLDKNLPGPDQASSLEPAEFTQLVRNIREVEACLGSDVKEPSVIEMENAKVARRSIVAKTLIRKGERLTVDNLTLKRPAAGLAAKQLKQIIGKKSVRNLTPDTVIRFDMLQG